MVTTRSDVRGESSDWCRQRARPVNTSHTLHLPAVSDNRCETGGSGSGGGDWQSASVKGDSTFQVVRMQEMTCTQLQVRARISESV